MGARKKVAASTNVNNPLQSKGKRKKIPLAVILFLPAVCILFACVYASNPRMVEYFVPLKSVLPWNGAVNDFLPPHPKNFYDAWSFGKLEERLIQLESRNENTTEAIDTLLQEAATIAKRTVSIDEFRGIRQLVIDIDNETSIISKVWGFFTFVNLIWIVSFLGLLVTVIPCIIICASPLEKLFIALALLLKAIFLSPVAFVLYEIFSWIFVMLWILAAHQYPPEYGYLLGFFAVGWYLFFLLLWLPWHGYILKARTDRYSRWGLAANPMPIILNSFLALFAFPMTFLFQSSLIGWVSVICLYSLLGFTVIGGGLCLLIGFKDDDAAMRSIITSFLFILFFSAYKIAGLPVAYILPFASPLIIMGNTVYFLGVLIAASRFSPSCRRSAEHYITLQLLMILSCVVAFFVGAVYSIGPMFNVACVFFVLYVFEKVIEFDAWYKDAGGIWILGFLLSISLFVISFFLHGHPNIIVSLFDSSWAFPEQ